MSLNHEEQDFYDYSLDDELYIFDKKESSRDLFVPIHSTLVPKADIFHRLMNKLDEKAVEIGHEVFSIYFMLLKELKFKYDKCYSNPHIQLSKYFEKEIQEGEISDKKCKICLTDLNGEVVSFGCCHNFHEDCLKTFIEQAISDKQIFKKCPCNDCDHIMHPYIVRRLLGYSEDYVSLLTEYLISEKEDLTKCPNQACGKIYQLEDEISLNHDLLCDCGCHFCVKCLKPAHSHLSCDQVKENKLSRDANQHVWGYNHWIQLFEKYQKNSTLSQKLKLLDSDVKSLQNTILVGARVLAMCYFQIHDLKMDDYTDEIKFENKDQFTKILEDGWKLVEKFVPENFLVGNSFDAAKFKEYTIECDKTNMIIQSVLCNFIDHLKNFQEKEENKAQS